MKISLVFLLVVLQSCSYFYYRHFPDMKDIVEESRRSNRPLFALSQAFQYTKIIKGKKVRMYFNALDQKSKTVMSNLFPKIEKMSPKKARFILKNVIEFEEDLSKNQSEMTKTAVVFSVLTLGIIPAFSSWSFDGEIEFYDLEERKIRRMRVRPKRAIGQGMLFSPFQWSKSWFSEKDDPYRHAPAEYYQDYLYYIMKHQ